MEDVVGQGMRVTGGKTSGQMHSLLGEFKGVYESRLQRLDDAERCGEDTQKTRVRVLQAYVNDLSEQNEVLVSTVEELEKEANDRVGLLESKLKGTSGSVKEYIAKARDLERELRALTIEKTRADAMLEELQTRLGRQEESSGALREENSNLNHDVNQLISVIRTARNTGRWETEAVRFRELSHDQVFGSHIEAARLRTVEDAEERSRDLRDQLRRKDEQMDKLQQEIALLRTQARVSRDERRTDGQAEREAITPSQSAEKDFAIMQLKRDLRQAEQRIEDMQLETAKAEEAIRQLKLDLSHAKDYASKSSKDIGHYERKLRNQEHDLQELREQRKKSMDEIGVLQERLRDSQVSTKDHHEVLKSELARRDETIQKLRRDVLTLQEKRDAAVSELDKQTNNMIQIEDKNKRSSDELHRLEARNKVVEEELSTLRKQADDSKSDVKTYISKLARTEGEMQADI